MSLSNRISGIAFLLLIFILYQNPAEANPKHFAFVNPSYIIAAEVASQHSFIVNFINLSDFVIVAQPNEFIYKGASGRFYIGQVYEKEHQDSRGESQRYSASILLKGRSFIGLTIVGAFREQDQIEQLSIRIGAKRFYLQAMEKAAFDQLAAKIGELDLQSESSGETLQQANIAEMGTVKSTDGTSEWDQDWQDLITSDGVNPPKILERPEISPTDEARKSRTYGKVKISCLVNKNGGIQDIKIVKGLGQGLNQRAAEGVKNSWLFLPATKNGEVLDSAISIEVEFPPPEKKD
jgi:TonB family protein